MNRDLEKLNQATYRNRAIVGQYERRADILPGEARVFREFRNRIVGAKLLDIGVGGGRTTGLLSELASDYTGIDLSNEMIEACKRRFPALAENFAACDARDLSRFADASFDVVLFSFNGLDYIPHEGRLQALKEIRRIIRPGGLFLFSTHLTPSLRSRFAPTANPHSDNWLRDWKMRLLFHWHNLNQKGIDTAPYSLVRDASHSFRLITYYSQPATVQQQLTEAGFNGFRYFGNYEEVEMTEEEFLRTQLNWAYLSAETAV
jgi:SAM-dependent methyltransferase